MTTLTEVDCLLCSSSIKVRSGERGSFEVHMSKNHLAVRNIDFLLIVSLLDEDERAAITQVISDKYLLSGSDLDRDDLRENFVDIKRLEDTQTSFELKTERDVENSLQAEERDLWERKICENELTPNIRQGPLSPLIRTDVEERSQNVPLIKELVSEEQMKINDKQDGQSKRIKIIDDDDNFVGLVSPAKKEIAGVTDKIMKQEDTKTFKVEKGFEKSFAEDLQRWRKFVDEIEKGPRAKLEPEPIQHLVADEILKQERFKCDICHIEYKLRADLTNHKMKNHMNDHLDPPKALAHDLDDSKKPSSDLKDDCETEISCKRCSYKCKNAESLQIHIKDVHESRGLKFGNGEKYSSKLWEKEVNEELKKYGKLSCKICNYVTKFRQNFSNHMRSAHGIRQRARRRDAWRPESKPTFKGKPILREGPESVNNQEMEMEPKKSKALDPDIAAPRETTPPKLDKTVSLRKSLEAVPINKSWSSFLLDSISSDKTKSVGESLKNRTPLKANHLVKDNNKSSPESDPNLLTLKGERGVCPKCFEVKANLRGHYLSVHIQGSFPCPECDKVLTSSHKRSDHRFKKHPKKK